MNILYICTTFGFCSITCFLWPNVLRCVFIKGSCEVLLSSINFYILIFSETTGSIGTKLGRTVHWMIPYKVYVFCGSAVHKRNKRNKGVKKGMSIYMGVNYLLFIWFLSGYFNAFLKKIPFRNIVTLLCSYWWYYTAGIVWLVVLYSRDHVIGCIIQQGSCDWLYHTADHVIVCIINQGSHDLSYHISLS